MDARHWVILAIANLALVGCRYHDPSIDLLESELRWMEDQLYLLEDEVQLKTRELALCKNGQPSQKPCGSSPATRGSSSTKDDSSPELLPPGDESDSLLEAPLIELPGPSDDSGPTPTPAELPSASPSTDEALDNGLGDEPRTDSPRIPDGPYSPPILELPSAQATHSDRLIVQQAYETPLEDQDFDPHVTHIVVHGQLAGGCDFDGRPGADGLLVVVEPRNADGQYVPLPGAVSVVALDAKQEGPAARIARWDFDPAEVGRNLRKSPSGRGVHLELAWPNEPPETNQLHVFARYLTADGRKLQADQKTDGKVSHPTIRGWTPAKRKPRTDPPPAAQTSHRVGSSGDPAGTSSSSLAARSASVLAVARQLEESVAAIEQTLSDGAVPRQLTPPAAARPLLTPDKKSEPAVQRPQWKPDR